MRQAGVAASLSAFSLFARIPVSQSLVTSPRFSRRLVFSSKMTSFSLKSSETGDNEGTKCVPCSSLDTSALLSRDQVQQQLESLPLWTLQVNHQTLYLSRAFVAKNFQSALDGINAMGAIAEREGHHPDFHLTQYRNVEINMWTHKLNGITQNDIDMCRMLDTEVEVVYSPKWLKEHHSEATK